MGLFRDCSIFGHPLLSQEWVKLRMSNFVCIFTGSIGLSEQKSIKNVGKSSRGRSQGLSKIFRAAICTAHRAVIFAIAQLSCNGLPALFDVSRWGFPQGLWLISLIHGEKTGYCYFFVHMDG